MIPDFDPAPIQFSVLLKATLWIGDVIPDILCKRLAAQVQNVEPNHLYGMNMSPLLVLGNFQKSLELIVIQS